MDRNTVIGFILIGALLIGMFYINSRSNQAYLAEKKRAADSSDAAKPKIDSKVSKLDSVKTDSLRKANLMTKTNFQTPVSGTEQWDTLETDLVKLVFTNKGGQIKKAELKKFTTFDGKPMMLQAGEFNKISYAINSGTNQTVQTADLLFSSGIKKVNPYYTFWFYCK